MPRRIRPWRSRNATGFIEWPTIYEKSLSISRKAYALSLDGFADRQVAEWAVRYKDPAFVRALDTASKRACVPNSKYVHARDLIDALSIIELCKTPEGRRELGLRPEDEDVGMMRAFPLLQAESEGKLRLVRGARRMWAGTKLPADRSAAEIREGVFELRQGLISFPLAFKIYGLLSDPSESSEFDLTKGQDAKKLAYMAIVRALRQPSIAKSIKTNDLLSPWDSKPIRYSYDGKQVKIEVSMGGGEFKTTTIPSDFALKPTK